MFEMRSSLNRQLSHAKAVSFDWGSPFANSTLIITTTVVVPNVLYHSMHYNDK